MFLENWFLIVTKRKNLLFYWW